ncbi:MAG: F0F1 ATP synthase subunit epsilon [Lentisphaerae bacterium]|nr:F0F1 ATP synthase subunit epsilon [Lentisphaerota bacterium]
MNTFDLEIVTPEQIFPRRSITSIDVPASNGRLTVLANHEKFICSLLSGVVKIRNGKNSEEWSVGAGTMTVDRNSVTLLVRQANKA